MIFFYSLVMIKAYHLENGEFKKYKSIYNDRKASMRHMYDSAVQVNQPNLSRRNNSDQPSVRTSQQQQHRNSQDLAKYWRREYRLIKTLGIVITVFILCWVFFFLRYTLCGPSESICPDIIGKNLVLEDVLFWIGYFNSALNPFLYNFTNRDFRRAFKHLLRIRKDTDDNGFCYCCCGTDVKRHQSLTMSHTTSRKPTMEEIRGLMK